MPTFNDDKAARYALLDLVRSVLAYDAMIAGRKADTDDYNELYRRVQNAAEQAGIAFKL